MSAWQHKTHPCTCVGFWHILVDVIAQCAWPRRRIHLDGTSSRSLELLQPSSLLNADRTDSADVIMHAAKLMHIFFCVPTLRQVLPLFAGVQAFHGSEKTSWAFISAQRTPHRRSSSLLSPKKGLAVFRVSYLARAFHLSELCWQNGLQLIVCGAGMLMGKQSFGI